MPLLYFLIILTSLILQFLEKENKQQTEFNTEILGGIYP